MENKVWQSAGGKATAIISRKKALERYYNDPQICKHCNSIIDVPEGKKIAEIRQKVFCNSSCSASYTNSRRASRKKEKPAKIIKEKQDKFYLLNGKTKIEIFNSHKNWQSARSTIRKMAVYIHQNSDKPKFCIQCGYSRHYEICHIKGVSEFDDTALIETINHIDNLIALCPNCHWEFDNLRYKEDNITT